MSIKYIYPYDSLAMTQGVELGATVKLAAAKKLGANVPSGMVLSGELCEVFYQNKQDFPKGFLAQLQSSLHDLGFAESKTAGLLALRVESRHPVPGAIDAIFNVGLSDESVCVLAQCYNAPFAYDCYRRFIATYSCIVGGLELDDFDDSWDEHRSKYGLSEGVDFNESQLRELCLAYQAIFLKLTGRAFPQDPFTQLTMLLKAFYNSWDSPEASLFRATEGIVEERWLAVDIQQMAFGNKSADSGVALLSSRDPLNLENKVRIKYLLNAQGDDLSSGLLEPYVWNGLSSSTESEVKAFDFEYISELSTRLKSVLKEELELEFVCDAGQNFLVHVKRQKLSPLGGLKAVVDMVDEEVLSKEEALMKIEPCALRELLLNRFESESKVDAYSNFVGKGCAGGPRVASAKVALSLASAQSYSQSGTPFIFVALETSPEDFAVISQSVGILTATGGSASHAAIMARQLGKPCVCGLQELSVDLVGHSISLGSEVLHDGQFLSIDGSSGEVFFAEIQALPSELMKLLLGENLDSSQVKEYHYFKSVMDWSDLYKSLTVRANADTVGDLDMAIALGAVGIGLLRVEHMFNNQQRLLHLRKLLLSKSPAIVEQSLVGIEDFMIADLTQIFAKLPGMPATVRLLDPPLHEFMPKLLSEKEALALELDLSLRDLEKLLANLSEVNPMLGHRGCRLGISSPALTKIQLKAIFKAALAVKDSGVESQLEIMLPSITLESEMKYLRDFIEVTAKDLFAELGQEVKFAVGAMIEWPRAALRAAEIARHADFFSFGTNDLTQSTLGLSRDDAGTFLPLYREGVTAFAEKPKEILYPDDPFLVLDEEGVGELVEIGVQRGRSVKKDLKMGVCGEHAGEPRSIDFFHRSGLDSLSCSPYRIPLARLAAAQAALRNNSEKFN
jgi:pyruvate, orthophosphate dikinase